MQTNNEVTKGVIPFKIPSNFNLFKLQTKQLLRKSYRKTIFYNHSFDNLIFLSKKKFRSNKNKNFDINSNRYSIILKKNNIN